MSHRPPILEASQGSDGAKLDRFSPEKPVMGSCQGQEGLEHLWGASGCGNSESGLLRQRSSLLGARSVRAEHGTTEATEEEVIFGREAERKI